MQHDPLAHLMPTDAQAAVNIRTPYPALDYQPEPTWSEGMFGTLINYGCQIEPEWLTVLAVMLAVFAYLVVGLIVSRLDVLRLELEYRARLRAAVAARSAK
jgi:hypothetical protein